MSLSGSSPDVWNRAQARMVEARLIASAPEWRLKNRAKFLLSGFVKCGVCGGNYIITNAHSYRCATNRDRGEIACANRRTISRRRLEAAVLAALREKLYTRETLAPLIADVRDEVRRLAAEHEKREDGKRDADALARVEAEIENVRRAILAGVVTETTREMLLDAEARRKAILEAAHRGSRPNSEERLASALDRLPSLIERHLSDLAALLAVEDVPRGKEIVSLLVERIVLRPKDGALEAEMTGNVAGLLRIQGPSRNGSGWKTDGAGRGI